MKINKDYCNAFITENISTMIIIIYQTAVPRDKLNLSASGEYITRMSIITNI